MKERFVVEGGRRLEGRIRPGGNKNAALPILAACLLTDEAIVAEEPARHRGREGHARDPRRASVHPLTSWSRTSSASMPKGSAPPRPTRGALEEDPRVDPAGRSAPGPLRRGLIAKPGGDAIGRRRVDTHLLALEALGAQIEVSAHEYRMSARALNGKTMFLDEASVTATENAVMAAVLARGDTLIYNAAAEPHVQDLCRFLNALGAQIEGIATNSLTIDGVESLHGGEFTIPSDHIEVGSYIGLAAVTRSELLIEDAVPEHMYAVRLMLEKLGVDIRVEGKNIRVPKEQELRVRYDIGAAVPKIDDGPWPLFPADLLSIMVVVATQAEGTVMIFEKMFESRLFFTDKLISHGRADHPLRSASRDHRRRQPAAGRRDLQPRHPRRHGAPPGRALREGREHHPQHPSDRPRIRAHRGAAEPARARGSCANRT